MSASAARNVESIRNVGHDQGVLDSSRGCQRMTPQNAYFNQATVCGDSSPVRRFPYPNSPLVPVYSMSQWIKPESSSGTPPYMRLRASIEGAAPTLLLTEPRWVLISTTDTHERSAVVRAHLWPLLDLRRGRSPHVRQCLSNFSFAVAHVRDPTTWFGALPSPPASANRRPVCYWTPEGNLGFTAGALPCLLGYPERPRKKLAHQGH